MDDRGKTFCGRCFKDAEVCACDRPSKAAPQMRRLTKKKLRKLRNQAEATQTLRDKGARGNVVYVFVDPKDLLALINVYETA